MLKLCYFSPCGNVRKIVTAIGEALAENPENMDFTLPQNRQNSMNYGPNDLVILGAPVYASRLPNKIMPFIRDSIHGDQTPAVLVVSYGNRSYGDALAELWHLATQNGFLPIAAAAVASEHSFAPELATGRPNDDDLQQIRQFAQQIKEKINHQSDASRFDSVGNPDTSVLESASIPTATILEATDIPGDPNTQTYYTPLKTDHTPAKFLKAVPKLYPENCNKCMACAKACPMGSIDLADPGLVTGICIKCQACIKVCPSQARYFDHPDFLSHRDMLTQNYTAPNNNTFIISE